MKRILTALALILLALPLANCQTTSLGTPTKTMAVDPPPNLYKCPNPQKPNSDKLTDAQAADYVNRLYRARGTCSASLNAIKRYSQQAVKEIENGQNAR